VARVSRIVQDHRKDVEIARLRVEVRELEGEVEYLMDRLESARVPVR
jgi:hypothetical protein